MLTVNDKVVALIDSEYVTKGETYTIVEVAEEHAFVIGDDGWEVGIDLDKLQKK